MLDNLMEDFSKKEEAMKAELEEIEIVEMSANAEVKATVSGNKQILDISIDFSKVDLKDSGQLEDLMVITLNSAMDKADSLSRQKMKDSVQDMLPPGLGDMFGF